MRYEKFSAQIDNRKLDVISFNSSVNGRKRDKSPSSTSRIGFPVRDMIYTRER